MKLFEIHGTVKCGHRLYELQKYVIADTPMDAVAQYRKEHPHAKCLRVHYKYDINSPTDTQIIFTSCQIKRVDNTPNV